MQGLVQLTWVSEHSNFLRPCYHDSVRGDLTLTDSRIINTHSDPGSNLCFTKRNPIGVCVPKNLEVIGMVVGTLMNSLMNLHTEKK